MNWFHKHLNKVFHDSLSLNTFGGGLDKLSKAVRSLPIIKIGNKNSPRKLVPFWASHRIPGYLVEPSHFADGKVKVPRDEAMPAMPQFRSEAGPDFRFVDSASVFCSVHQSVCSAHMAHQLRGALW